MIPQNSLATSSTAEDAATPSRRVTDLLRLKFLRTRQRSGSATPKPDTVAQLSQSSNAVPGRPRGRSLSVGTARAVAPDASVLANLPDPSEVDAATQRQSPLAVKSSAEDKSPTLASRLLRRPSRNITAGNGSAAGERTRSSSISSSLLDRRGRGSGHTWDGTTLNDAARRSRSKRTDDEMRTVKGVFKVSTTSLLPPDKMVAKLEEAIRKTAATRPDGTLKAKRKSEWLFRIDDTTRSVRMEIEVCKIEKLDRLHGVRFARLRGDTWLYKQFAEELMANMTLM